MSFHHECVLSEVDVFAPQYLQTSITKSENFFYSPLTSLDGCNIIEFLIPASSEHYKDLNSINLHLKVQLLKSNGEVYKENQVGEKKVDELATQPALVNFSLHSIFKSVNVYFNNKLVSSTEHYNFKSYLDVILNADDNAINTSKYNEGFVRDSTGTDFESYLDKNKGMKERRSFTANSAICDFCGPLNIDIFKINRLLLPNVDIKIVLALDNANFFIKEKEDQNSIMKIHEANIQIKSFTLNPNIVMGHLQKLRKGLPAIYPFRRSEIKTFSLAAGIRSSTIDSVFSGVIPSTLCVVLLSNANFTGLREKNPFYFFHQHLSSIAVYVNSQCITQNPIEMSFPQGYSRVYHQFLEATNKLTSGYSNSISKTDFRRNYCIYPFIISPTQRLEEGNCSDLARDGSVRIELKFAAAPTETLTVLVYAEFDAIATFDAALNASIM